MPMYKKQKKEIKRKGAKHLVRTGKKVLKAAAGAATGGLSFVPKVAKAGSCVARGMKRGLSLAEASSACGITKRKSKPLKIKRTKGKARMTSDVKKV